MTIYKQGSTGLNVEAIQTKVNVVADGIFGPVTEAAVRVWQSLNGLSVDGIVGPLTWAAMFPNAPTPPVQNPSGVITMGIDIYHGDDMTNWSVLVPNGWRFAFIKASENYSADSMFKTHWANAKAHGVLRGAYHFIHFNGDGKGQAQAFAKIVEAAGFEDTDLPPVLDFEHLPGSDPKPSDINIAVDFMNEIQSLLGRKPIIYLSRSVPGEMGNPVQLARWTNWVASYTSSLNVPAPWSQWQFWQYSDSGHVPGVGNPCDVDKFNGSVDELVAFIKASKL